MKLFLESLPVHDLGDFTISSERQYEGAADAPQRVKVTLKVRVDVFEESYAANHLLGAQLTEALRSADGLLQWQDDNGTDYLNQTVTILAASAPEEWGTYHQSFEMTFSYYEHDVRTANLPCTYLPTGGALVTFTNILEFKPSTTVDRFHPQHSHRRLTTRRVALKGLLLGDPTVPIASRRAWLQGKVTELNTAMATKDGVLKLGASGEFFSGTVRVTEFAPEVDNAMYAIPFTLAVTATAFPDESNFATVEYTVERRDPQTGELFLKLAGKITADTEARARTKYAALKTAVLGANGFAAAQPLAEDTVASNVDANADGAAFLELSFSAEFRNFASTNNAATFQKTGSSGAKVLPNVRTYLLQYGASRFNQLHSQRNEAVNRIELAGTIKPTDPAAPLADRRTELTALVAGLHAEVNGADGTLNYGGLVVNRVVRVAEFRAEINQEITGIEWNLSAEYSAFPDEGGFATCEFSVTPREEVEAGEKFIGFSGRIRANSKTVAFAKLAATRTSVLATYGYTEAQIVGSPSLTYQSIYANGDATAGIADDSAAESAGTGTRFMELNFSEEYRKRSTDRVSFALRTSRREDVPAGLVLTTLSGFVSAGGANVTDAYNTALAKAEALGRGQEATLGWLRGATINWDKRQTTKENVEEFVRLEFSYEYQGKLAAGSAYQEVQREVSIDPFGQDIENVSGFMVAATDELLTSAYATLRETYSGRLIRGERTSRSTVTAQKGAVTQVLKLDFSFQVFNLKADGIVNYRYGISTERDFLALTLTRRLHGTAFATTSAAAAVAVEALAATLNLGTLIRSGDEQSYNFTSETAGVFERYDFDLTYQAALTGVTGILTCQVAEDVTYSGERWVAQPTLKTTGWNGYDQMQSLSTQGGSRKVSGEVTAPSLAVCEAWAKKHRALLTGDADGVLATAPEQWKREFVFPPRVDGIVSGTGANVQMFRLQFTFAEILPNYPAPA